MFFFSILVFTELMFHETILRDPCGLLRKDVVSTYLSLHNFSEGRQPRDYNTTLCAATPHFVQLRLRQAQREALNSNGELLNLVIFLSKNIH